MFQKKKYDLQQAKTKIMKYCAIQERSHFEVELKLKEWGVDPSHRGDLSAFLIENNFLNEERFARAYVRGKFRMKKWGRRKIQTGLIQKRISDFCQREGFKEIDEVEYRETLIGLVKKKVENYSELRGLKLRSKIHDYLITKGYENELINEVIRDIC